MLKLLRLFLDNKVGSTAIEYGLIAALITVVLIAGLQTTGIATEGLYSIMYHIGEVIDNALGQSA